MNHSVEAGVCWGWHRYTGERGAVLGVRRFGVSASGKEVLRHYGFTVENVITRALAVLNTPGEGVVV